MEQRSRYEIKPWWIWFTDASIDMSFCLGGLSKNFLVSIFCTLKSSLWCSSLDKVYSEVYFNDFLAGLNVICRTAIIPALTIPGITFHKCIRTRTISLLSHTRITSKPKPTRTSESTASKQRFAEWLKWREWERDRMRLKDKEHM